MFEGFCPETVDFLWGIRMNNNREWFLEHKKDYVNHLYAPMKALGKDLFQPFLDKSGCLLKVSRIYRDARMHHPLPYKESLWICIAFFALVYEKCSTDLPFPYRAIHKR